MIHKCSNNRILKITNIETFEKESKLNWIPCAVLLTAWTIEKIKTANLNLLINSLLTKGARIFVCAGTYSEQLHDEIDEIIYKYGEEQGEESIKEIITTYHEEEPIEDVLNYFINGTVNKNHERCGLLALLDINDHEIRSYLKKS
jgi:hypothetical protein